MTSVTPDDREVGTQEKMAMPSENS